MPLPRFALALIVLAVPAFAALLLAPAESAGAQPASTAASGCGGGVTLNPASKQVRRGGRVLLTGRLCGANASRTSGGRVKLKIRSGNSWRKVGAAAPDPSGFYSDCVRIRGDAGKVRVRASAAGAAATAKLAVSRKKGARGCGACPLSQAGSAVGMTLPSGCTVVASDTSSEADPIPFYGTIDCANASRHQQLTSGGDPHPMAVGGSQPDSASRQMTVVDGDDFWGERCELGHNDWPTGPTVFYHEGVRRITYMSFRLPPSFELSTQNTWQGVMQMKQTQPSDNGGGPPALSIGAYQNRWKLFHSGADGSDDGELLWDTPAQSNVWTRIAIDAVYSQHASLGSVKMYVDLNADSDFSDPNEQSPTFHTNTLKRETGADSSDGIVAGASIPSHLRVGMYHDPELDCPTGCSLEADNIQVIKP